MTRDDGHDADAGVEQGVVHQVYPDPALAARSAAAEAVRALSEALVGYEVDEELLARVTWWAHRAAAEARQGRPLVRAEDYQARRYLDPRPPDGRGLVTSSDRPVSGPANPAAVAVAMRREGDEAVAEVVFDRRFEGSPGRVHGGMTAAVMDDVMGYVNVIDGVAAYTLELKVRYVAGMPLDTPVEVRAHRTEPGERRSTVVAEARTADGTLVAEAEGLFAILPPSRFGL